MTKQKIEVGDLVIGQDFIYLVLKDHGPLATTAERYFVACLDVYTYSKSVPRCRVVTKHYVMLSIYHKLASGQMRIIKGS
jgi:hypothetical protein